MTTATMDPPRHHALDFDVKAFDDATGTFTGMASTWDLDLGGDVIRRGAFRDWLKEWKASGDVLPLFDSHAAHGSVLKVIGKVLEAKETADGLEIKGELLPDDPTALGIYRRIKGGYVKGLSIGYSAQEVERPSDDDRRKGVWRILRKVNLREVSIVVYPMNPKAGVSDVKSVAGALDALIDRHESLGGPIDEAAAKEWRALAGRIGTLLRAAKPGSDDDPVTPPAEGDADDEPKGTTDDPEVTPDGTPDPGDPTAATDGDGKEADTTGEDPRAPSWLTEALAERMARHRRPDDAT